MRPDAAQVRSSAVGIVGEALDGEMVVRARAARNDRTGRRLEHSGRSPDEQLAGCAAREEIGAIPGRISTLRAAGLRARPQPHLNRFASGRGIALRRLALRPRKRGASDGRPVRGSALSIQSEIDGAIEDVIATCAFVGGGEVRAFEEEFAQYGASNGEGLTTRRHRAGCANGTDARWLTLRAMGVGGGDEVITVAKTFIAAAESIVAVPGTFAPGALATLRFSWPLRWRPGAMGAGQQP